MRSVVPMYRYFAGPPGQSPGNSHRRSKRIGEQVADDERLAASTEKGFIAWLDVCTRYCQRRQSTSDPLARRLRTFSGRVRATTAAGRSLPDRHEGSP